MIAGGKGCYRQLSVNYAADMTFSSWEAYLPAPVEKSSTPTGLVNGRWRNF
jgi:hypothetical protein